jgi:sepiapterin reductase
VDCEWIVQVTNPNIQLKTITMERRSTLLVITGASRGIGRAIGTAFAQAIGESVRAILIGRHQKDLMETQRQMGVEDVVLHIADLSYLSMLDDSINVIMETARPWNQYKRVIVVNNAGSMGHLGPTTMMTNLQAFQEYINLNITSSLWFTTRFARELQPYADKMDCTFINISSLCAVSPVATMAPYCTGKAARDMFHTCLAKEIPSSSIKILNWAPGAVQTDMTDLIRANSDLMDDTVATWYREAHESGSLLLPSKTAHKLVQLVLSGDFQSGAHIDYWDFGDDAKIEDENLAAISNTSK